MTESSRGIPPERGDDLQLTAESSTHRDVAYYQSLCYPYEIIPSSQGGYVAHYPDIPGCAVEGETIDKVLADLNAGWDLWIRAKLEAGEPVPEPATDESSGKLILNLPIRLHSELDELAAGFNRSLNRLLNDLLLNYTNALPPSYGLGEPTVDGQSEEVAERRYAYRLTPEPGGTFVAEHPDLPGCAAAGDTPEEAMAELDQSRDLWLQERKRNGLPVPKPLSTSHSGMIDLRMPPELHASLIREAQRNSASVRDMIIYVLSAAVGELKI